MIITVFEDQFHQSLFPLNQIKASFELRCGAFTNIERIQNGINPEDEIQLFVRNEIKELIQERHPNLTVNPSVLSSGIWLNIICQSHVVFPLPGGPATKTDSLGTTFPLFEQLFHYGLHSVTLYFCAPFT